MKENWRSVNSLSEDAHHTHTHTHTVQHR